MTEEAYDWAVSLMSKGPEDTLIAIDSSPEDFFEMAVPMLSVLHEIYEFSDEELLEALYMVKEMEQEKVH